MTNIEVVEGDRDREELFERWRDRVFDEAHDFLEQCTLPLVIEDGESILDHRSGILLQIADMRFLVTAGHHMVEHSEKLHFTCITMPEKGMAPVRLVNENFWTTKDAQEDISVTQLTTGVVNYIKEHYRFIRLNSVMSRHDPTQGKGLYLIYGFPYALVGLDGEGDKKVESWKYLTIPFQGDYSTVEDYNPRLHLVLTYERQTRNQAGMKIHPPGMSGGGIWSVGTPYSHPLFTADDFKLVAIQNCWHKGVEYAKGTWIDDVLLILWKYYPDTHKPLMLAGYNFFGR